MTFTERALALKYRAEKLRFSLTMAAGQESIEIIKQVVALLCDMAAKIESDSKP